MINCVHVQRKIGGNYHLCMCHIHTFSDTQNHDHHTKYLTVPVHLHSKWWYSVHMKIKQHDIVKISVNSSQINTYQLILILDEHWLHGQLGQKGSLLETNQCCSIRCGAYNYYYSAISILIQSRLS